jgi:hypothetical protein
MSESIPHVVRSIRAKRDEIFQQIADLEKRAVRLRAQLTTLDAAAALLVPDHTREINTRRNRYFARNELTRLVMDTFRKSDRPLGLAEIGAYVTRAKGLPSSASEPLKGMILAVLTKQVRQGSVTKTGHTRDARWSITESQ